MQALAYGRKVVFVDTGPTMPRSLLMCGLWCSLRGLFVALAVQKGQEGIPADGNQIQKGHPEVQGDKVEIHQLESRPDFIIGHQCCPVVLLCATGRMLTERAHDEIVTWATLDRV